MRFVTESWNVRGLGDEDKCISVFADLSTARPSLLAIQESKLGELTAAKAASFLPPSIRSHRAVDAVGTSGGLVSAWDQNLFSLSSDFASRHVLSLDLAFIDDGTTIRFSNVYAPCDRADKALFLELLASHDPGNDVPWIIAGDFNLTRDPADRNNDNFSLSEATMFNDAINNLCLFELPLMDRHYTWSNRRDVPTLVRLDRVFVNHAWNLVFPSSTLSSLARDTSDHVPLIATISTLIPKRGYFRYDTAWSLHASFKNLIRSSWGVLPGLTLPLKLLRAFDNAGFATKLGRSALPPPFNGKRTVACSSPSLIC
jgi:exonuclease III